MGILDLFKKEDKFENMVNQKTHIFKKILNKNSNSFTDKEIKEITNFSFVRMSLANNPTPAIIITSLINRFTNLNKWQALAIYIYLMTDELVGISGGKGSTLETAFNIYTNDPRTGILTEASILFILYGEENIKWQLIRRYYLTNNNIKYQQYEIQTSDKTVNIYFNNTQYFATKV